MEQDKCTSGFWVVTLQGAGVSAAANSSASRQARCSLREGAVRAVQQLGKRHEQRLALLRDAVVLNLRGWGQGRELQVGMRC